MRPLALLFAIATALLAANQRLYLKDGDYQLVTEYEVKGDRVRYFSAEGKVWEEIPLELVDLKKTEKEAVDKAAAREEMLRLEKEEDDAIKADKRMVSGVPEKPGVYMVSGMVLMGLTEIDAYTKENGALKILQKVAPGPMIPGKATILIDGKAAKFRITNPEPEFFFRLAAQERLSLVRLETKKNERVVANVIIPQVEADDMPVQEEMKNVDSFKKQYEPLLYKIWTQQPLPPGEYAIVEYTEGKMNPRVWDFGVDKK